MRGQQRRGPCLLHGSGASVAAIQAMLETTSPAGCLPAAVQVTVFSAAGLRPASFSAKVRYNDSSCWPSVRSRICGTCSNPVGVNHVLILSPAFFGRKSPIHDTHG